MNRQRAKLLVADCHEDTLIDLQRVLEDAGFDTTAVWTSREFVDAIHRQAFDLALINEYMPGAPCQELLQLVRDADLRCVLLLDKSTSQLLESLMSSLERTFS
jgi:CheY-like chemotaxis protein